MEVVMMWIGICIGVIGAAIAYVDIKAIIEWRALRRSNQKLVDKLDKLDGKENEVTKNLE